MAQVKTRAHSSASVAVVARDSGSGVVERVGSHVADDPKRLTWALVSDGVLRRELTRELDGAGGRTAVVTYTHRTIAGALREPRRPCCTERAHAAATRGEDLRGVVEAVGLLDVDAKDGHVSVARQPGELVFVVAFAPSE
ncbi:MAG: hypothetical protein M3N47_11080 [Chloroflexota bacterium]|nr:hypothetical protein [Chloroflexota bacterium]